jgi:methionyl-tRNA formyltransferase
LPSYRIVFFGTPEFAVPAFHALHESRHEVALVVTQPDRPKGRGRKMTPPPIKEAALSLGYEIVQPQTIKSNNFAKVISKIDPDILVVIAFGQILTQALLDLPGLGAINIHASLLPKFRGAAPIQWAIINGEQETGVTTMIMDAGMDTGDILLSKKVPIGPDDTSATLHDKLAAEGAALLMETLDKLASQTLTPTPQDPDAASFAPLLTKKDGHIDWSRPARDLENFIRGVNPWPGAFTFCGDLRLKIYKSKCLDDDIEQPPGTVLSYFPGELRIATGKGSLLVQEIQGASGKCLATKDFLCGCCIEPGAVLT